MNKKILTLAWVLISSSLVFSSCTEQKEVYETKKNPAISSETEETWEVYSEQYQEYSAEKVEKALLENKKVALYFHDKWCGTCNKLKTTIKEHISHLPGDSVIFVVDFYKETELKAKYWVTTATTLVYLNWNTETFTLAVKPKIEEIRDTLYWNKETAISESNMKKVEALVHEMPKNWMKKVLGIYPDLKKVKTVSKWSKNIIIEWMWAEDWMYSKKANITVVVCNEMNTPAYIFKWKKLEGEKMKKAQDMMKEMMDMMMDWDHDWDMDMMMDDDHDWDMWMMMDWEHNNSFVYDDYSAEKLKKALSENKKVALFFHARWCASCKKLEKEIKEVSATFPENSIIFNANYDEELELKKKYWVTTPTTLIFFNADFDGFTKKLSPSVEDIKKYLTK